MVNFMNINAGSFIRGRVHAFPRLSHHPFLIFLTLPHHRIIHLVLQGIHPVLPFLEILLGTLLVLPFQGTRLVQSLS